jgi:type I restriction enzyme S subunit
MSEIPVPPHDEQHSISKFLDETVIKYDELTKLNERLIDHLREYRQTLISAAVTGKIDVREDGGEEVAV